MNDIVATGIEKKKLVKQKSELLKTKTCKVLKYDKNVKVLDVLFDRCGIRFYDVETINGDTVEVQYKGTIGKDNFEYSLKK